MIARLSEEEINFLRKTRKIEYYWRKLSVQEKLDILIDVACEIDLDDFINDNYEMLYRDLIEAYYIDVSKRTMIKEVKAYIDFMDHDDIDTIINIMFGLCKNFNDLVDYYSDELYDSLKIDDIQDEWIDTPPHYLHIEEMLSELKEILKFEGNKKVLERYLKEHHKKSFSDLSTEELTELYELMPHVTY